MGKQEKILGLIRLLGGEIPLSELETRYYSAYGEPLGVPQNVKLETWIWSFDSIGTRKASSSGDESYVACERPWTTPSPMPRSTHPPPPPRPIDMLSGAKISHVEEGNIQTLITQNGGKISLSVLKDVYRDTFGLALQCPKGFFRNWIERSDTIGTRKSAGGNNDYEAFAKASSNSDTNEVNMSEFQEGNILTLIRESGGQISLSNLRINYKDKFGVALECPKRQLREWIDTSNVIGTKKSGKNDHVAFERRTPRKNNDDDTVPAAIVADEVQRVDSDAYFTTVGKEPGIDEPQMDCDAVVEKLMSYVGGNFKPTIMHQDSISLLNILPMQWSEALATLGMEKVSDISLDLGRRPYCWHNYERKYLSEDDTDVVEDRDIRSIVDMLQDFGDDNRAGIDGQLHRISCIRNNSNSMIGLTIRVGRHIEGNSDMIRDLLEENDKSILLLGEVRDSFSILV